MATRIRTIEFLPDIFKTKPNEQFLNATLDQLVQPPNFDKIQGFIGSKFGYGVNSKDNYLTETSTIRTNYQLEPAVIFKKKDTTTAVDLLTYPGIIDALELEGGITLNHNKLFSNEFYSWDSFTDLDKLINFSQYYWVPEGPEAVEITTETLLVNATFDIVSSSGSTYDISVNNVPLEISNPTLTLVRGGSYLFNVGADDDFYIQTQPGVNGVDVSRTNVSTRDIAGVEYRGSSGSTSKVIAFDVPLTNAQDDYNFAESIDVDLVTTLSFDNLHGKPLSTIKGIDGVLGINGKTLIFYGSSPTDRGYIGNLYDSANFNTDTQDGGLEGGFYTNVNSNVYRIELIGDDSVVRLKQLHAIPDDTKLNIQYGKEYITRSFIKNSLGEMILIPNITARLDTLYYQGTSSKFKFGKIKIVDNSVDALLNVEDILGSSTYISPNGIKFSNGLKVRFTGRVYPEKYLNDLYYVEGVGTKITLVPVSDLIVPEPFSQSFNSPFDEVSYDQQSFGGSSQVPYEQDYITINRSSIDRNAWSRSNRWFHVDVLNTIVANNTRSPIANKALTSLDSRAKRPIIEFYPDLKLLNSGSTGKMPVDYLDNTTTDALSIISGGNTNYHPDGADSLLYDGARIVFAKDNNIEVRNKIYVATVALVNGQRIVTLSKAVDGDVDYLDQIIITKGTSNSGYSLYFDGDKWISAQRKERINQPPLFDIFDSNGISFSNLEYYPGTDFTGCTLFQYAESSGVDDTVLKFPIRYSGVGNISDIVFDVSLNSATFNYVYDGLSINQPVNTGYVHQFITKDSYKRKIGWETAVEKSFQYQIFNLLYNDAVISNQTFVCDIAAKDSSTTKWPTIIVYVDNNRIDTSGYTVSTTANTTIIQINDTLTNGVTVDIMIYSDQVSSTGYYQIPSNLDHNPFNSQISLINSGDIRGHFKSICNNVPNLTGAAFGANNYRDLGNVVPYGMRIVQNSASLPTPAAIIRKQSYNFFNSVSYNATEYVKFKSLLVSTVNGENYTPYQSGSDMLDDALDIISSTKSESNPFFWSDMLPSKTAYVTNTYTFKVGIGDTVYPLTKTYDFSNANYNGVLVYVSRFKNGINQVIQMIRNVDYVLSETDPYLLVMTKLVENDVVTVKEYNQTYGSFVPNTPTKLGLYPTYIPDIILDDTYLQPTFMLKGHDGSLTRLYGEYNDGFLQDFRDKVLYEFEMRIYNNIKVNAKIPIEQDDIIGGYFRQTEYSREEFMTLYNTMFLNWAGLNRIEFKQQYYDGTDEYTWNYTKATNKLDNLPFNRGSWRSIYLWLYDTVSPHLTPWEMLGLPNKPNWWASRYGNAPYTSTNDLLWDDLSKGFVWNDGDPYINTKRVRPELSKIIPVDKHGNLLSPFTSVVNNYNQRSFKEDWKIGDVGPAEYAYLKSSTWPFDLMRLFALTKPAMFFSLGLNLDTYKYNTEFKQYLANNRSRTTTDIVTLYGTDATTASHSYLNWMVDYLQQYGLEGSTILNSLLSSLDVRLVYKLAGYSDKNQLNFYVEKGSPNSKNNSLLIPDDSYDILLYRNEPDDTIIYSSVIVQKTDNGFRVYGNSQNKAYFKYLVPISSGSYTEVSMGSTTIQLPSDFTTEVRILEYGHEFTSEQSLSIFVNNYGKYLETQGLKFMDVENSTELNWKQMIVEFLYWNQSGWEVGSSINLNPCANNLTITKQNYVVQSLSYARDNFILNQNSLPIQIKDLSILRKDNDFDVKVLIEGDSINYAQLDLSNTEHVVVFDNETVFNDVIFNLTTGLRQQRLYVRGTKTSDWDGTITAPGFILNENNVLDWTPNVKYNKGTIVRFKREYWMANELTIAPSTTFNYNYWLKTNYNNIHEGLLPNPSTRAYESMLYYDEFRGNLESDGDILGFSLIGYRPRNYLADANLNDSSQIGVYKNMIGSKGTRDGLDILQGIELQNHTLEYDIYENWAIKSAEYGGVLNHNFIEFTLNETMMTGNPAIVGITNGVAVTGAHQQVPLHSLVNYGRILNNTNVMPVVTNDPLIAMPNSGYVNLDDVSLTGYTIERLDKNTVGYVYANDYIWIADKQGDWNVYTPVSLGATITTVLNNLNDTVTITFNRPHNLSKYDAIGIINYDYRVDGYYVVSAIGNSKTIIVDLAIVNTINLITPSGTGMVFKLQSQRLSSPTKLLELPLMDSEYNKNTVWIDKDVNNDWVVYRKTLNYELSKFNNANPRSLNNETFGTSVAYIPKLGYFVGDPGAGKLYQYIKAANGGFLLRNTITKTAPFGKTIARNDEFMVVSSPGNSSTQIYVYRIVQMPEVEALVEEQVITVGQSDIGTSMAFSGDSNFLYLSAINFNSIIAFQRDVDLVNTFTGIVLKNTTTPLDKQFVVKGNHVTGLTAAAFKPGRRVTFYKYSQYKTSYVMEFGYIPQGNYFTVSNYSTKSFVLTFVPNSKSVIDVKINTVTQSSSTYTLTPLLAGGAEIVFNNALTLGDSVTVIVKQASAESAYSTGVGLGLTNQNLIDFLNNHRKYYLLCNGYIPNDTSITFSADSDPADYKINSIGQNSDPYLLGGNTLYTGGNSKFFTPINAYIYVDLFTYLDSLNTTSFTNNNSNAIKVYTPAALLKYVTVITAEYDSGTDATTIHTVERIGYNIAPTVLFTVGSTQVMDTYIRTVNNNFSILNLINAGTFSQVGDKYGYSIATTYDGTKLFVGAPKANFRWSANPELPVIADVGYVYVHSRLVETWTVQYDSPPFSFYALYLPWSPGRGSQLYINGVRIEKSKYIIILNLVLIGPRVKAGDIVSLSSVNFVLEQQLASYEGWNGVIAGQQFGTSVSCNSTGSELIVGAPYDRSGITTATAREGAIPSAPAGQEGAVYRYTNEGKRFGRVTAFIAANNVLGATYLLINGYSVPIPNGDAYDIADAINIATITNVFAYVTEDNRLVIRLRDMNLFPDNNKISLQVFNGTYYYLMGIAPYTKTQVIRNPHQQNSTGFGHLVKFNEFNSFIVSAPFGSRFVSTKFDFSDDDYSHNDTVFDNHLTKFEDEFTEAGAVYMYDYVKPYAESLLNTGQYIYAQSLNDLESDYGKKPLYGSAIAFNDYVVMVGSPNFKADNVGGRAVIYVNDAKKPNWSAHRKSSPIVDVDKIKRIQLYSNIDDSNLDSLDYFDPLRGKLLGVVAENLDFISVVDPAGYNNPAIVNGSIVWSNTQVGKLWFDISTVKFMNYHQDDLVYNAKHWGNVFPGSTVAVYTWIESDVTPAFYTGVGTPYDLERYTVTFAINSNNSLVPRYYFWVRKTNTLYGTKTLTDSVIEQYISNPQSSGISYFAPLKPDTFALYNSREYINGLNTNMHIGFSTGSGEVETHNEYKLIRSNYPEDFLPGFVNKLRGYTYPESLYDRFLDSLSGVDETGATVPNINLPSYLQIGVNVRPRQGFFINRFNALKNYLAYANSILAKYTISEFGNLTFLTEYGDYHNTRDYWTHIYWWAEGYSDKSKTAIEVASYPDLLRLTPKEGLLVGVAKNGQDKREVYSYTDSAWIRVGLQDGTIKFLDTLWDYQTNKIGFGDNFYDTVSYDSYPSTETRNIIRALNEQIYTGPLLEYRNKSLILMFEYIQSENTDAHNYLPWLNKTSFADVVYTVRNLEQEKKYQRDNENLISGFVNEVKPYHSIIKEFGFKYNGLDPYTGDITDFDLPPKYNASIDRFETPKLKFSDISTVNNEFLFTDTIWQNTEYQNWFNHYGLKLESVPNSSVAVLANYMKTTSNLLKLDNARGIPIQGIMKVDDELIGYAGVDRETGVVSGVIRGLYNSSVTEHYPGAVIYMDLPGVVVLDTGRNYIDPPTVTAYVDTDLYPAPTREANLLPIMAGDKVIGVKVVDPGENYPVSPQIIISGSYSVDFTDTRINYINNTVLVPTTFFETGDLIRVTALSTNNGSIKNGYYYVYVVAKVEEEEIISITLHKTRANSIRGTDKMIFKPPVVSVTTEYRMELTARAIPITSNSLVRGIQNTLRFDRTSYVPKIQAWKPDEFWSSPYSRTNNDKSSSNMSLLYYSRSYTNMTAAASLSGSTDAKFTINNVLLGGNYSVTMTTVGAAYRQNDVIRILGSRLAGANTTNDCVITVTSIERTYVRQLQDSTNGSGVNARFNITSNGSTYTAIIDPFYYGTGYQVNDLIYMDGSRFNGTTPANNLTIRVTSISSNGKVDTCTVTGTPVNTGVIKTFSTSGLAIDAHLASFQGAVLPITGVVNSSNNAVVELDYSPTIIKPGQLRGISIYFYRVIPPYVYDDTGAGGAKIEIYRPRFNPGRLANNYFIKILDTGSIYRANDTIVVPGASLGGVTGKNDAIINIDYTDAVDGLQPGGIQYARISGSAVGVFNLYYLNPINESQAEVYKDISMRIPVRYSEFIYEGGASDFAYAPEPIYYGMSFKYDSTSIVTYDNKVWRCIESNNDRTFIKSKWVELESDDRLLNALDRIVAYYEPAINMPPKDLQQLVKGISYPNNTYYGNTFSPDDELPLDFELKDQPFYPRDSNIKAILNDGNRYIAIGDSADHSFVLISNDGITWQNYKIADVVLNVTGISYFNDQYVVTTKTKANPMIVSFDAQNWITTGNPVLFDTAAFDDASFDTSPISIAPDQLNSVIYANGFYYAVGEKIYKSQDGIVWLPTFSFGGQLIYDIKNIIYVDSKNYVGFVAVGGGYQILSGADTAAPTAISISVIVHSLDGNNWESQKPNISRSTFNVILNSGDLLVIAGDNSEIYYGINGYNWTPAIISGTAITDNLLDGVYANGRFVIVGENGTILSSVDGISWIQLTNSDITTETLNGVSFDGTYFYAVGANATVVRSMDGVTWSDVSYITTREPFSVVKGSDFLYGYGPEELVPGVVSDSLSLQVLTAPGSYWDDTSLLDTTKYYEHTGFNMVSKIVKPGVDRVLNFDRMVKNPINISVFIMDDVIKTGRRIYEDVTSLFNPISYSVNWITKTVTISETLASNQSILIEVYEVGNGKQIARSNSEFIPFRINPDNGFTEMHLNIQFVPVITYPVVYHNGKQLDYNVDYYVTFAYGEYNYTRILFNELYDHETDYISFALLDTSINDLNPEEYMFSLPTTQVFSGEEVDGIVEFTVKGYVGGNNNVNAIVELNGSRLVPNVDYSIDSTTNTLTITLVTPGVLTTDDILAITTYNETQRLFLSTASSITKNVTPVYTVESKDIVKIITNKDAILSDGDLVRLDGFVGSVNLNNNTYYVKAENTYTWNGTLYYPYSLYTNSTLTNPVFGEVAGTYISGGYIWKDSLTFAIAQPIDPEVNQYSDFIRYNEGRRAWVTVNGKRVDPSNLKYSSEDYVLTGTVSITKNTNTVTGVGTLFTTELVSGDYITINDKHHKVDVITNNNSMTIKPLYTGTTVTSGTVIKVTNKLNILTNIEYDDVVLVTSMVDGATPNAMNFTINVDSKGKMDIYRTNDDDSTWLVGKLNKGDDIIYVYDVNKVTDTIEETTTVSQYISTKFTYIQIEIGTIKEIKVYNQTTLTELTSADFSVTTYNNRHAILFYNNASEGDVMNISVRTGDIVTINGEKIRFTQVDRVANTLSGLTRGVLGTSPADLHEVYDIIYGLTNNRRLDSMYYGTIWNTSVYSSSGDPLQISNTAPVNFLKNGYY